MGLLSTEDPLSEKLSERVERNTGFSQLNHAPNCASQYESSGASKLYKANELKDEETGSETKKLDPML